MKIRKFIMPRFGFGLMTVILAMNITGCAANGSPEESTDASTTSAVTTMATVPKTEETSPTETTAEKATKPSDETQGATAAASEATTAPAAEQTKPTEEDTPVTESQTQASEPATTQATSPPETEPPATDATDPPETQPPETEPPHNHSYSATSTVAPGCECDGYTVYECSCGSSYTDDYVSATGHSWGEWATTKEPTSSAEGEKARTCSGCGAIETASIEKLPAEQIDTAALEEYGRQYGANVYGFNPVIGTRAGYYPGDTYYIDSMEEGRAAVAASVALTADWLVAAGKPIVLVIDGVEYPFMLDVEVVHEGGNQYCVWVYYG